MFKQVDKLYKEVQGIHKALGEQLESTDKRIRVNKLLIDNESSLSQYLYAIGILSSQIAAAKLMGEDEENKKLSSTLDEVLKMRKAKKEYDEWYSYLNELHVQKNNLHELLSNEEKASLIEIPNPPSGFNLIKGINLKKK